MALNGVIASFATGTYAVARETSQSYDANGRLINGTASSFNITASVQPVSGRDLKNLPEAQHGEEMLVVYTTTELRTRTPTTAPDIVTIRGEPWAVVKVNWWDHWGDTHYVVYVSRVVVP